MTPFDKQEAPGTNMEQLLKLFGKMEGGGEATAISFSKFPNSAEMRRWMDEPTHKCSRSARKPMKVVTWLKAVEMDNNSFEDFSVLGRL